MFTLFTFALVISSAMANPRAYTNSIPPPLSQNDFFEYWAGKGYKRITGTYLIPGHTISLMYGTLYGKPDTAPITEEDVVVVAAYATNLLKEEMPGDMWMYPNAVLALHVINDAAVAVTRARLAEPKKEAAV